MTPKTRIVRITATRCFLGQATVEIPAFATDDRILNLIRGGDQLAAILARRIPFDRIDGTGLARCHLSTPEALRQGELHIRLSELISPLRADGFQF